MSEMTLLHEIKQPTTKRGNRETQSVSDGDVLKRLETASSRDTALMLQASLLRRTAQKNAQYDKCGAA